MLLDQPIKDVLLRNNDLRKIKNDAAVKSSCLRIIHLFISYDLYSLNESGNVIGFGARKLESLTNFELLHIIESVICSNDTLFMDAFLAKSIQSIDSVGQCWYYPKELSLLIFEATGKRYNYKKIRAVLNRFVNENICLKVTNKKRQSMYRILFTYSVSDE